MHKSKPDRTRRIVRRCAASRGRPRPGSLTGTSDAPSGVMLDSETARDLIKPYMPVVCSLGRELATVDHVEGHSLIKLTKDDDGQHHYIPLSWVTSVDDRVHLDRPEDQARHE